MAAMVFLTIGTGYVQAQDKTSDSASELPKVYLIKEITPENLVKIYEALGRKAEGKVAVKLSTGEPGGHNFLQPTLIAPLVRKMNRAQSWSAIRPMVADVPIRRHTSRLLPTPRFYGDCESGHHGCRRRSVPAGKRRQAPERGFRGQELLELRFYGCAVAFQRSCDGWFRRRNQEYLHRHRLVGRQGVDSFGRHDKDVSKVWGNLPEQDNFLESMAEAAKAVTDHCGDKILYISVANNLSVDCDCDSSPEDPRMGDIGILASLDPVALDRACTDLVRSSEDHGKIHLIERIDSRHGMHTLDYAEQLGMGSQKYELVELK